MEIASKEAHKSFGRKTLRELKRIPEQIYRAPTAAIEYLFATVYHDALLSKKAIHTPGQRSLTDRVAIYVVFPKSGLTKLHWSTINHLNVEGYSSIVVVNGTLSGPERESIICHCHLLIERKNFGYDFGAYRTGLLHVRSLSSTPEYVAIINDSCWFPVEGSRNWLKEAEALNVDMASALTHSGSGWLKRALKETKLDNEKSGVSRRFHHCSFALLFSKSALNRPEFWTFWKRLHLSSERRRTVKWGERALSAFIDLNGFSHGTTLSEAEVANRIVADARFQENYKDGHPAYFYGDFLVEAFGFQFKKTGTHQSDLVE